MIHKKEEVLHLTLKDKEISTFKSIVKKFDEEGNKMGFNNKQLSLPENKLMNILKKALGLSDE